MKRKCFSFSFISVNIMFATNKAGSVTSALPQWGGLAEAVLLLSFFGKEVEKCLN